MADTDIFVRLGADIEPLKKGLKSASSRLDGFGKKARASANQMAKVAAAATIAGAAIGTKLVSDSMRAIDAQAKLARMLGTTNTSLAVLDRAAEMAGISLAQIEKGAKNLEVAMGEAAQGTGIAKDTLEQLQITAKDLEGMTLDEKINKVNKAILENIPATERAAASADLFGKKAGFAIAQLTPEGIEEARRQVEGLGLAVSEVEAGQIEKANDAIDSIKLATKGVVQQFTFALSPIVGKLATKFQEAAIETGGFKDEAVIAVNGVAKAIGFVADVFNGLSVVIKGAEVAFFAFKTGALVIAEAIVTAFDFVFRSVKEGLNVIIDGANKLPFVNLEKLFVGKTEGLKLLEQWRIDAVAETNQAMAEMNQAALAPVPSEAIEEFVASVQEKANREVEVERIKNEEIEALDAQSKENLAQQAMTFEEKINAIKSGFGKQQVTATKRLFGDLATLQQSHSRKAFEVGKASAMAQTVISTYQGAQEAFTALAGIPIVGPALGIAAAGAAIVAGGVRLQAINSTSFGGKSSPAGSSGGSGGGIAASNAAPPQANTQQNGGVSQDQNIFISGFNKGDSVDGFEMIEKINSAQENGARLVLL